MTYLSATGIPVEDQCCGNCRYYDGSLKDDGEGHCKHKSPSFAPNRIPEKDEYCQLAWAVWPRVTRVDRCGDWSHAPEERT